jgi:nitroreductase
VKEIYSRRSIRKYTNERISDDILEKILKAGMNAPSARNTKPYEFVVVRDKDKLDVLASVKANAYMVNDSDIAIVMLLEAETEFWQLDLGATVQNMLLEAESFNIGSCWIGINKDQESYIKQELNIPDDFNIVSMISFGYKAEIKDNNNNYYHDKVHYEKYS